LAELEDWAKHSAEYAHGRGKSAKGHDLAAVRILVEWAKRFSMMRNGLAAVATGCNPDSVCEVSIKGASEG